MMAAGCCGSLVRRLELKMISGPVISMLLLARRRLRKLDAT